MIRRTSLRLCSKQFPHINQVQLLYRHSYIHLSSKKQSSPTIEENPGTKHFIKEKIWRFIRRETLALKNVFEDDLLQAEANMTSTEEKLPKLDRMIQKELEKQTDDYNRFLTLLTFHPILVHPNMYYSLRSKLPTLLQEAPKNLYIKRLVYHQQYKECWKLILEDIDGSTLTDLEDYLNIILWELGSNNDFDIGLRSFMLCGFELIQSPGLLASIEDYIYYKTNIPKEELYRNYSYSLELQAIDTIEELEIHKRNRPTFTMFESLLQSKRQFQLIKDEKQIWNLLFNCCKIFKKSPGWLSFLVHDLLSISLPYKTTTSNMVNPEYSKCNLAKLIPSIKGLQLNDYDYFHVLQTATSENSFGVFLSYQRSKKEDKTWNKYILNHLAERILQNGQIDQITRITLDSCHILEEKILLDSFRFAWDNKHMGQFRRMIKRIQKKRDPDLLFNISRNLHAHTLNDCDLILKSFYKTPVSNKVAAALFPRVHLVEEGNRKLFYERVIQNYNFNTQALVELFRSYLVRENGRDPKILSSLFETILAKSFSKDKILSRANGSDDLLSDFQALLKYSTRQEKARFHNRIRAIAQSISLLQPEDVADVFNMLQTCIRSQQFIVCIAKHGRKYILNCLVYDTLRFIDRKKGGTKSIEEIKKITKGLRFQSQLCEDYAYKIISRENPLEAIKTFSESKRSDKPKVLPRSLLRFIASGLLESPRLSRKQKLLYFEEFKRTVESKGQSFPLSPFLTTQVAQLVLCISKEESLGSLADTTRELKALARDYGIPYRVQKGLTKGQ